METTQHYEVVVDGTFHPVAAYHLDGESKSLADRDTAQILARRIISGEGEKKDPIHHVTLTDYDGVTQYGTFLIYHLKD